MRVAILCCALLWPCSALQPLRAVQEHNGSIAHFPRPTPDEDHTHLLPNFTGDISVETFKQVAGEYDEYGDPVYLRALHKIGKLVRDIPTEEHLWPYPAKVGVVILLFIIFEYVADLLDGLGLLFYNSQCKTRAPRSPSRHEAEKRADPTIQRSISVLTLNVWVNRARENSDRQIESIRRLAPDVICLQEVFHMDVLETYRMAFPDYCCVAFGRAQNLSALLSFIALMIAWAACFSGAVWLVERYVQQGMWRTVWLIGVPLIFLLYTRLIRHHWTIAFLTGNRTGLAMLVRRDSVEIQECRCNKFSRMGHAADLLNLLRPRGFISVAGLVRLPGYRAPLSVRFVTTHLNQPLEQALGDGRHRQVKEVMQRCLKAGELLVLGCDLNATPPGTMNGSDCNTYQDCLASLEDAWAATNPSDPKRDGLTWDQKDNPLSLSVLNKMFYGTEQIRWRCDYIFWRFCNRVMASSAEATTEAQKAMDKVTDHKAMAQALATSGHAVTVRSCTMVFTGNEAVSDHYGVHSVFDIRDADPVADFADEQAVEPIAAAVVAET